MNIKLDISRRIDALIYQYEALEERIVDTLVSCGKDQEFIQDFLYTYQITPALNALKEDREFVKSAEPIQIAERYQNNCFEIVKKHFAIADSNTNAALARIVSSIESSKY